MPIAIGNAIGDSLASQTQGQGPWSSADYRNGSDIESDNFNPSSAYGHRNGMDIESDAFRPAMAYSYRNGSDVESDNIMAAREAEQQALANNRTMLNAAERAARPEAYMSIERLPRVVVAGVSQATLENVSETQRLLRRSEASSMRAQSDPYMDPFSTSPDSSVKSMNRSVLKEFAERMERSYSESEKTELRRAATTEVMTLADKSIIWALGRDSTSPLAKVLLTEFMGADQSRSRVFGPNSDGTHELFSGTAGKYFENETQKAMEYMAKKYGGTIPDGASLTRYKYSDFGAAEGLKGAWDGFHVGDVVGTFSTGVHAIAKNGILYFSAGNMMTLESFAAQNSLGHSWVESPIAGRYAPTRQVFQWARPIPGRFYSGSGG